MKQKRWTLLVVPDGNDPVRTLSMTRDRFRVLGAVSALACLVAILASGLLMSRVATPSSMLASRTERELSERLLVMQARLDSLHDTLQVIGERDTQLRLFAGLPRIDSQPSVTTAGSLSIDSMSGSNSGRVLRTSRARNIMERLAEGTAADMDDLIRRANSLATSFAHVSAAIERNHERSGRIPSIMPTAGWLSSAFTRSRFHPILHVSRPHEGIDVSAPMGAPIVAPAAGTVTRATRERGYGLVVEIDHGDGITTRYAHCSRISVRPGQRVKRGEEIAAVGNTGLSTGPHLHYEIHVNGKVIDPLTYVLPSDAIPD
ncbi:MAG: M23 family metallopeptidase [Gemmatimonadaceae bacterium]